jgi:uncharacterized membrane protein HdeD (DUF308 family)
MFVVMGVLSVATGVVVVVWPDITLLALGVIALIAGVTCIRRPGESLLAIVMVVGVYLIAAGVIRAVRAFDVSEGRAWALVLAVLEVAVGCLVLSWPNLGLATVAILFAASMLIRGLFAIVVGVRLRGTHDEQEPPPVHAGLAT